MNQPSDQILVRLARLHPKLIDLSLGRIERLLAALGHPERHVPPAIHVAGTNGKGSTLAYLRAIFEAAGLRAHVYTSPHLVRFHERIRVAGFPVAEDVLSALLEECERANGAAPITFFEITTAAAFLAFARTPADVLLLEVGLGGRLDATNVIVPALCAITPVSLDHQHYLGDTLVAIAGEKAGILKRLVPAIVAHQEAGAGAVIEARARACDAPLRRHGREWTAQPTPSGMVYRSAAREWHLPAPALPGRHQIANAGLAAAIAEAVEPRFGLTAADVARGISTAQWPARMQRLRHGPLVNLLPPGSELWLDGGHNPAAGLAIAAMLDGAGLESAGTPGFHLVIGMLATKDAGGFLAPLIGRAASLSTVAVPGSEASLDAKELAEHARALGATAEEADSVGGAVRRIAARARGPARVLICGSLYLAGSVLAENG
ncbi:MAG: bifunctional folylpolyglutamate synthase/dihydrofolate synthase [Alphaproteobacteria bacterium]